MSRLIIILFLFYPLVPVKSQNITLPEIFEAERALKEKFTFLRSGYYQDTDSLNTEIIRVFSEILNKQESFLYSWPELDMIGKVSSSDHKVNIFTWNMQNEKGEHFYSGIIQYRFPLKRKNYAIKIFTLSDHSKTIRNPESQILSPENWFGALYYSCVFYKYRKNTYYVLLGFDFNNPFSNKKIIEILQLKDDSLTFGKTIKNDDTEVQRIIFEYSSEIVMSLRYNEVLKKIVFDHLAPISPMFKGTYRFYAPDGSYDALGFEKGEFILERDVDARNF